MCFPVFREMTKNEADERPLRLDCALFFCWRSSVKVQCYAVLVLVWFGLVWFVWGLVMVSLRLVSSRLVLFRFVSFRFVSFRFVSFRFVLFRFVS